jgi:hypothetical protein
MASLAWSKLGDDARAREVNLGGYSGDELLRARHDGSNLEWPLEKPLQKQDAHGRKVGPDCRDEGWIVQCDGCNGLSVGSGKEESWSREDTVERALMRGSSVLFAVRLCIDTVFEPRELL